MEMEVGHITSALSSKLVIEDIDECDQDNPQLCAEYVKEIYAYMMELEVWLMQLYVCCDSLPSLHTELCRGVQCAYRSHEHAYIGYSSVQSMVGPDNV